MNLKSFIKLVVCSHYIQFYNGNILYHAESLILRIVFSENLGLHDGILSISSWFLSQVIYIFCEWLDQCLLALLIYT